MSNEYSRLFIMVKGISYYDIGLRKGNNILSKTSHQMGGDCPRYLEDFIEMYDKRNIEIKGYGKLIDDKEYIDNLLK